MGCRGRGGDPARTASGASVCSYLRATSRARSFLRHLLPTTAISSARLPARPSACSPFLSPLRPVTRPPHSSASTARPSAPSAPSATQSAYSFACLTRPILSSMSGLALAHTDLSTIYAFACVHRRAAHSISFLRAPSRWRAATNTYWSARGFRYQLEPKLKLVSSSIIVRGIILTRFGSSLSSL